VKNSILFCWIQGFTAARDFYNRHHCCRRVSLLCKGSEKYKISGAVSLFSFQSPFHWYWSSFI